MSIRAMNWAMAQRVGGPGAKVILMAYADYADENGVSWPAINKVAAITEQSRATVQRYLRKLEEIGAISRRQRTREDGSQTSDEVTLLLDRTIAVPREKADGEDVPPVANCDPPVADIDTGPVAPGDTPPVSIVLPPSEPSLDPPETPKTPNPFSPGEPPLRVVEIKIPELFDPFFANYPGSKAMDRRKAAAAFARLTPEKQLKARKAAPLLAAELARLERRPKDAHKWLEREGFEQFDVDDPAKAGKPAFVFVPLDGDQYLAWDIWYRVASAETRPAMLWSDNHQSRGFYVKAEWPPLGRGLPTDESAWVWVDYESRQWWAWTERMRAGGVKRFYPEELLGPIVMKTVIKHIDGEDVPVEEMDMDGITPRREWRKRGRKLPADPEGWPPPKSQSRPPDDEQAISKAG